VACEQHEESERWNFYLGTKAHGSLHEDNAFDFGPYPATQRKPLAGSRLEFESGSKWDASKSQRPTRLQCPSGLGSKKDASLRKNQRRGPWSRSQSTGSGCQPISLAPPGLLSSHRSRPSPYELSTSLISSQAYAPNPRLQYGISLNLHFFLSLNPKLRRSRYSTLRSLVIAG
jgi:hypothetical protein